MDPTKDTLYIDMDGVLFDLKGELLKRGYVESQFNDEDFWNEVIIAHEYDNELFLDLPEMPLFKWLSNRYLLLSGKYNIMLLTYIGEHSKLSTVYFEKLRNVFKYPFLRSIEMVPVAGNKHYKALLANYKTILIDDDISTCQRFKEYGGEAIHVSSLDNTEHKFNNSPLKKQLENLL